MTCVVVFDSGLGSFSIIKAIQKNCKCEITYFADQKNFPYGTKSKRELERIITKTLDSLKEIFNPEIIVIGSNTPSLMLDINHKKIFKILPPLKHASSLSKTKNIGILTTKSATKSTGLSNYIKKCNLEKNIIFHKINASPLIELVESGKFLTNKKLCQRIIKEEYEKILKNKKIDVCTLSSTHLPFLKKELECILPQIIFLDPAQQIAEKICKNVKNEENKNSLKIYSSTHSKTFEKNLRTLKIKNKINFLSI